METLRRHSGHFFAVVAMAELLIASLLISPAASGSKLELSAGSYQFAATNKRNQTTKEISGVGSYRLAYRHSVSNQFEIDAGYSILATDTVGGDLAFGFDLGINFFPFTSSSEIGANGGGVTGSFRDAWRPFVGIAFHQRNFQSTSSQYAGVGIKAGAEYQWRDLYGAVGYLRYISLGGPNNSEAAQVDFMVGAFYLLW